MNEELENAIKIVTAYAKKKIEEINNMEHLVAGYYFEERKTMRKLLDILEWYF